ncbi:MAG: DUF4831 family protein [Bacteroidales bacterium]
MKKQIIFLGTLILLAGCATETPLHVLVTPLGAEPGGAEAKYLYALPATVLKVEVSYQETKYLPGPYGEYAERYLGITDVIRQKMSAWRINGVSVTPYRETDPDHYYTLNVMDGTFDAGTLTPLKERGIILDGTLPVHEHLEEPGMNQSLQSQLPFIDLGTTSNFEERTETMYKTLVTDTSFVQVPVERSVVEQKSPARKAEEAANFLLELRTRRLEMLTGEYEVFPDGEAMEAAIRKLDQMEASYLSLFTGKTFTRNMTRSWFIVPGEGASSSTVRLGMFSEQLGFVPEDLMEGSPLEVQIEPSGTTALPAVQYATLPGGNNENVLLYRLPEITLLKVSWGERILSEERLSIYQKGALISNPL